MPRFLSNLFTLGDEAPAWLQKKEEALRADLERTGNHVEGHAVCARVRAKRRHAAEKKRQAAKLARRQHRFGSKAKRRKQAKRKKTKRRLSNKHFKTKGGTRR